MTVSISFYSDCKGICHSMEECRQKRFEVANRKIKPTKQWVPKAKKYPIPTVY